MNVDLSELQPLMKPIDMKPNADSDEERLFKRTERFGEREMDCMELGCTDAVLYAAIRLVS